MQHPRVRHEKLTHPYRHVHRLRMVAEHPLVGLLDLVTAAFVGRNQMFVQIHPPSVAPRNHPQAAVADTRVRQVPVEKDLLGPRRQAHRIVPTRPVLVPIERRRSGRLGDDLERTAGAEVSQPQRRHDVLRVLDQEVHHLVPGEFRIAFRDVAHTAHVDVGSLVLPLRRVSGRAQPPVRPRPEFLQLAVRQSAVEDAVAVVEQLPARSSVVVAHVAISTPVQRPI